MQERRTKMRNKDIKKTIDLLIDKVNEIIKVQKEADINLFDETTGILVYDAEKLLEYADILETKVKKSNYVPASNCVCIEFKYRGYIFDSFPSIKEYDRIKEKVLPPTKVTEPIQNNK